MTDEELIERAKQGEVRANRIHLENEVERLRAELAKHQESEFHPDWSLLQATRESLKESWAEAERLRAALKEIDAVLRVPAAEYVPAISDAFSIIDKALKQ